MALDEDTRADPALGRRSRILGGPGDARSVAVALLSTALFGAVLVLAVGRSAGWPEVREAFFDGDVFGATFGEIAEAFLLNVEIFLIAEAVVLVVALLIAVLRSLPGAVFFPLRALATGYVDLFRGVPLLIALYLIGFGVPALRLQGVPTDVAVLGTATLILIYSAYVA